jgi:hypothetical protein
VASAGTAETVMDGGDTAVKSAAVETSDVKSAAMETSGVKPAAMETSGVKPAAMEPTVETAAMSSASMPPASARLGEIWLAENSRAQQRSCNTRHGPCLPRGGFVIA